jgi:hypothetical protein
VQLLLAPFASPLVFIIFSLSIFLALLIVFPSLRSAITSEGRGSRWAKAMTGINAKYAFTLLFILWALFFGTLLQLVPQIGANSPYGAIGLIALFSGFFVMMGLLWAVIRD